jgi:uncharacterized protein (TIGR03437 family)
MTMGLVRRLRFSVIAAAVWWLGLLAPSLLTAQGFEIEKLVNSRSPRPDGGFFFRCLRPSIEGTTVVFRATSTIDGLFDSIWSTNLRLGGFTKLAGRATPVPGGSGTFSEFDGDPPVVAGGVVAFLGQDSSTQKLRTGLYTISASGGPIRRVADYTTTDPAGGDNPASFSLSSGQVIFRAANADGQTGIYLAAADGSAPVVLADSSHPFHASSGESLPWFVSPSLMGNRFTLVARSAGDPEAAHTALLSGSLSSRGADGRVLLNETINERTRLSGNLNEKWSTRVLLSSMQEDGLVVFSAADVNSAFKGIFTVDAGGAALKRVVSTIDALPGLGRIDGTKSFNSFSARGGQVAFKAEDESGKSALFVSSNGVFSRVIASGEEINGQRVRFFDEIGPTALDQGRLVFWASLELGPAAQSDEVLAVATQVPRPVNIRGVQNAASYAAGSIAPGELVTIFGDGIGPAQIVSFQKETNDRIATELAATRILFSGRPAPLLYVWENQCSVFVPYEVEEKAVTDLVVEYNGVRSAPVTLNVTSASPGLFAAQANGAGQGAILNEDGSLNSAARPARAGSIVVVYGTGEGQSDPPGIDGQIADESLRRPRLPVSATIGGAPATVLYLGSAPGSAAGIFQANLSVPAGTQPGNIPVVLTIGTSRSQGNLTVAVR